MSSPPTSNTSTKAAHLHIDLRRSASLPPFAALNPFRKKSSHKPARSPSPIEPYEVAPGIWNTDATAKVFGYLEIDAEKERSGGQVAEPQRRYRSQIPKRKPVVQKGSSHLNNEAHKDDLIDDILHRPPKLSVQITYPLKEDQVEVIGGSYQGKIERGRMRTVSRDDQLIQRGANPRTGLVSPVVVSDNSDDLGHDHTSLGKTQSDRPLTKGRTRSGKWKQDGVGWSLVESPLLSPIAQSSADPISRRVSCKELEDKLLVEMPGVDNPKPKNMTDQQMRRYQESVARACRRVGANAMIDPNTIPPSPRPSTPEGPSTPPNKLRRIRRKMVGSGPSRKGDSNETVIVAEKRASSMPTPRKGSNEMQKVRMVTPSNTPKGSSRAPHSVKSMNATEDPFLGQESRRQSGQTASGTHFPSLRTTQQQEAHRLLPAVHQSPPGAKSVERAATPTLSQYLPSLQFLHPSHFANLETSSYRRPTPLLPARLRPLGQQRETIEDAYTITTTSISSPRAVKEQRPKVQRRDGSIVIPRANQHSPLGSATLRENLVEEGIPMKKHSYATKLTVGTSDLKTAAPNAPIAAVQMQDSARPGRSTRAIMPGAALGARAALLEDYRSHQSKDGQARKCSGTVPTMQGLRLGSANIVRDPAQKDENDGAGTTHTSDHLGDRVDGRDWSYLDPQQEQILEVRHRVEHEPSAPRDVPFKHDCGAWFAGHWVETPQDQSDTFSLQRELPERNRSIFRQAADTRLSAKLQYVHQRLHQMACHITQTLHPKSSAMTILRTPNVRAWDYLQAAKDLILAGVYLLLLLNVLLALKNVLVLLGLVVYWVWHPVSIILAVVRWCALA